MELWDIYDRDRNKTGKTMKRASERVQGEYHVVVHVCIFNTQGEMLIQQRQPFKEGWPNMWDLTVGGSATNGESSQTAAERETFEEIGYKLDLSDVRPYFTMNFKAGFDDYYLVELNVDIDKLQLQYEEVQRVKWASKDEIVLMIENGDFIPYYKIFLEMLFEMLFEMRKQYGVLSR